MGIKVERGLREAAEEEACGERIAEEELHSSYFPSISQPLVTALQDDCVLAVAVGTDFTMALTNSGTVFGWGSNTSGQPGKPPVYVKGKGENNKVLVMKTTQRVIQLQHGLQNSCDVPNPVQGLTETGVYSEVVPDSASPAFANLYSRLHRGNAFPPIEPFFHSQQLQTFLHTTVKVFPDVLDTGELILLLPNHFHCNKDHQKLHLQASCYESASC